MSCKNYLKHKGWDREVRMYLGSRKRPGPVDAAKAVSDGRMFAVEWETGNISSSHRSLNKLLFGLLNGDLAGGMLIVPSRKMYIWLTDRIGNFDELAPYFVIYQDHPSVKDGLLAIVEVEHDDLSLSVPRITKGTDGRALV